MRKLEIMLLRHRWEEGAQPFSCLLFVQIPELPLTPKNAFLLPKLSFQLPISISRTSLCFPVSVHHADHVSSALAGLDFPFSPMDGSRFCLCPRDSWPVRALGSLGSLGCEQRFGEQPRTEQGCAAQVLKSLCTGLGEAR